MIDLTPYADLDKGLYRVVKEISEDRMDPATRFVAKDVFQMEVTTEFEIL